MFFRKKDKEEVPVIGAQKHKPPVPPKRTIVPSMISSPVPIAKNDDRPATEPNDPIYDIPKAKFALAGGDLDDDLVIKDDHLPPVRGFDSPKEFNIQGLALPALAPVQVKVRTLTLHKGITGDFGFSIRRVQFPSSRRGGLKTVVFAEPSEVRTGPPRPDDVKNGLLPGDQLIKIDGKNVDSMSRDELQNAVRSAGEQIVLEVKSVPELAEFCDRKNRQAGGRVDDDQLMLGHINTNLYEDIPEEQRYWLIHKGGYTIVRLIELLPDGQALVRVAAKDMTVDSTDIDRMNPTHLDRVGDVAALRYLNETSTVHLLRQRFGCNLLHTNAGLMSLVCLTAIEEGAVGQDRLVSLFKGCRRGQMPAHIYATAQQVYRNLQMTGHNQCVVLTGNSGSGKTTQLRNFVHYLAEVAGWTRSLPYEKLARALGILEAFGHAAVSLHRDSTRFLHLFSLGFDKAAALRSARLQVSLLEADRVVRRHSGEASFHVFYYLWEGAEGTLRDRLQLDSIEQPAIHPYVKEEDKTSAKEAWNRLLLALTELGFSENQILAMSSVLAAILHIQAAGCTPGSAQRAHFLRVAHAQQAAALLGVSTEDLGNALFRGKTANTAVASKVAGASRVALTSRGPDAPEALVSFCAGLYQELFYTIVELINKALQSNAACTWISILDYAGSSFHSDWMDGNVKRVLGLNDLVHNYINERVTELFYNACFVEAQEVYSREQVDIEMEMPLVSPCPLTRLLDQRQQLLSCTDIDRRSEEKRGLFAILEEESMFPGATDESLLERIFVHLGDESRLIHRANRPMQFVLEHAMSCYPVTYDVAGWVKQAQPCESAGAARPLLVQSKSPQLISLFAASLPNESTKLRRATQAAQFELSARRSISGFFANISGQIDYVFSSLRRGHRSHFVHCIQPSPNMRSATGSYEAIDVPFVRSQLRSILLIDSIRANNRGYPERVSFRDFRRRFGCLVEDELNSSIDNALDDRAAVSKILESMDIHQHRYRLGISQVLLAADVLCELEDRRELSLSGLVTAFQRECRRHLASKWLQRRRVLETAIRCIQKNGKAYMKVREWPWWRLYTKVVPLLAATRSDPSHHECEVRIRQLEQQLHQLRVEKTQQQGRVEELEQRLADEVQTAHDLTQALDREGQTRVQLERRLQQWREGVTEEERISRVSSSIRLESDEKTAELKTELVRVQQAEEQLRAKTQRAVAQLQDVEAELNKVRSRNETLEKKQQRFDADIHAVEEQLREAKEAKEKVEKERDEHQMTLTKKAGELQELKTENSELRTTVARLKREAEERSDAAAGGEQLVLLQKAKRELENKLKEQEEELDDLAGTNQQLQQQITRLEMGAERLKADLSRESTTKDTEIDEIRGQYQRRLRTLEDQLADLQDTNSSLVKENRVLEARARQYDLNTQSFEFSGEHYRRELRKALALLADTQTLLAHERESAPSQSLLRQLRDQLEDAEAAKMSALKGRHGLESELNEVRVQLEQALVAKSAAEDRALILLKEKNSGMALIEEKDEQYQQLMRKYKAAIQQTHLDHIAMADHIEQIAELEKTKQKLTEQLNEETSNAAFQAQHTVEKHKLVLCEQKARDLEAKLDLEIAQKQRLESIVIKLRDEVDSLQEQINEASTSRDKESDVLRKARKENQQLQETIEELQKRDLDSAHKKKASRDEIDRLEESNKALNAELKLAFRRIESLQAALSEGLGDDESDMESDTERALEDGVTTG
ncbi:hypothetical protein Q1695_004738 [Nippostrongylus brasiliensis]|nr:hypothetical protein Q1695_004738 [Nippostrongylus brasiliensis]